MMVNFTLIPFVFLLLPVKLISSGYGMIQVASTEIFLGLSSGLSAIYVVKYVQDRFGWHHAAVFGFILITLGIFSASFTSNIILLCVAVSGVGAGICFFNVTIITARSLAVPAGYRSAMESCLLFFCTASVPIGLLICSTLIDVTSSNNLIRIGSFGLFLSVACLYFSNSMRNFLKKETISNHYFLIYQKMFE
jgi:hypothetical protein